MPRTSDGTSDDIPVDVLHTDGQIDDPNCASRVQIDAFVTEIEIGRACVAVR